MKTWRCFHCDKVFRSRKRAAEHFGVFEVLSEPACRVDPRQLRRLERELREYRNEDTALHRQIHKLESEHAAALRRAEESGYHKGLMDGMKERDGV